VRYRKRVYGRTQLWSSLPQKNWGGGACANPLRTGEEAVLGSPAGVHGLRYCSKKTVVFGRHFHNPHMFPCRPSPLAETAEKKDRDRWRGVATAAAVNQSRKNRLSIPRVFPRPHDRHGTWLIREDEKSGRARFALAIL
jgi:hypothetical protein